MRLISVFIIYSYSITMSVCIKNDLIFDIKENNNNARRRKRKDKNAVKN